MQGAAGGFAAQLLFKARLGQAGTVEGKFIRVAIEAAAEALKGRDIADLLGHGFIAHRNAKAGGFMIKRRSGDKTRQHRAVNAHVARLGQGQGLAGLRLDRADFLLQLACVAVDGDLLVAHAADRLHIARQVCHTKAAQAKDQQGKQDPNGRFRNGAAATCHEAPQKYVLPFLRNSAGPCKRAQP